MFKPTPRQWRIRLEQSARDRRFIRSIGESRLLWIFGFVLLLTTENRARSDPWISLLPIAILFYAGYRKYFPRESLYDDEREPSVPEATSIQGDTATKSAPKVRSSVGAWPGDPPENSAEQ